MTGRQAAAAAAIGVAAGVLVWGWQSGTITLSAAAGTPGDTGHLAPGVPAVHPRHPLHRRHDGHAMRAALTGGGWTWYLNPPGEAAL